MTTTEPEGHSPLGGSSMSRAIACPGSVGLSYGVIEEDSEYAAYGTAAHAVAEWSLEKGFAPWSFIGEGYSNSKDMFYPEHWAKAELPGDVVKIDKELADAVQVYIDAIEDWHPRSSWRSNAWIEEAFYCPELHEYYWGRSDFSFYTPKQQRLDVWDYKNGAGVIVEVKNNVQGMYYACGILEQLDLWERVDTIGIHIVQPRGWHRDGPVRQWEVSTDKLLDWMNDDLLPAMDKALVSEETNSGTHCRFCPARGLACPQIDRDLAEMEKLMESFKGKTAAEIPNDKLGRFLKLFEVAKIANKAQVEIAYKRMQAGNKVPNCGLVPKRSNRVWKDGALSAVKKKLGDKKAMTLPVLKSPAQVEALPGGKDLTAEWAYKPDTGLTVKVNADPREHVDKDKSKLFSDTTKKRGRK